MNITRFEPWSLADLLHRDLNRLASSDGVADWVPAVDIVEEKSRFVVHADLPGVDPADIEVAMDKGVLSISGTRHAQTIDEGAGFQRTERTTGRFYRRFSLPETADAEGIKATSRNGILELSIPKQPEVQARRITVEAA